MEPAICCWCGKTSGPGCQRRSRPSGLIDQLRDLHTARLGLGAGIPTDWPDRLLLTLVEGGNGYCMHGPLRDAGGRERRFVEAVESLGSSLAASDLAPGARLGALGLHPGNVLVDADGLITAVIDTDFACAGDATLTWPPWP